ncbi:type II RES/Xre toxin-antitoxin system antitoxin [Segetibacter koreensis]|uniref:type II RES/Xre toxin-antitoxin system antitoxin n=1 Tax=Segetibacter koreensis TaxID=398037 RepID=UPI00036E2637|nr:antitoxin Xre/MbcA/ParS toxin-binding domain-containing protein [Segetibacter koreensis]
MKEKAAAKPVKEIKGKKNKNLLETDLKTSKNIRNTVDEESNVPTLAEPLIAVNYSNRAKYTSPSLTILNGAAKKPESRMTSFEKISMIKEGISKKDLENLKDKAGFDYNQLSKVLSVARATLINKKGNDRFDMNLSEKIVSVADIYSYGYEVFEDETKFNDWIFRTNRSLGGQAPYDLLDSQYGREEVKNLIGRIDYGVYS